MMVYQSKPVWTLPLPDGRVLAYCIYGEGRGQPLLYFHGGGSSRLEPAYADGYASHHGIQLISIDRPGYGGSSPRPGHSFQSVARDALELADVLGLDRFSAAGMSAGAPFALHLAALAPSRVKQVVLINASPETTHPAWKRSPLKARLAIRASSIPILLNYAVRSLKKDPAKAAARMVKRGSWTQESAGLFKSMIDEGLRQEGSLELLIREARMILDQSWNLDWSTLRCPVLAICGLEDQSRTFYQQLAKEYSGISTMDIPGPHMPIVARAAWDRIGETMAAQA